MSINYAYIDINDPEWLQDFWKCSGLLTILVNVFGIWMIMKHSSKDMQNYKYYLLNVLLWSFMLDMIVNWFLCPGFMMPLEGMYWSTSCLFANIPPEWAWLQMVFCLIVVDHVKVSIIDCFLCRLWTLNEKSWFQKTQKRQIFCCVLIHLMFPTVNALVLWSVRLDRSTQLSYVAEYFPNNPQLLSATNWVALPSSISNLTYLLLFWLLNIIVISSIIGYAVIKTILVLKASASSMSKSTIQAQQHYIRALILQCTLILSVYLVPLIVGIFSTPRFFGVRSPTLKAVMVAIFSEHSTVNVIAMCWTVKPYRNAIKKGFQRVLKQCQDRKITFITKEPPITTKSISLALS